LRAKSATLITAEKSSRATPYIAVHCCKEPDLSPQYSYSTQDGKLKLVDHVEEPYNSTATLIFNNNTHDFPDLLGYRINLAFGYTELPGEPPLAPGALYIEPWTWIGAPAYVYGNSRASPVAPLWVIKQTQISKPGDCDIVLYCIGAWNMLFMREDIASILGATSPYYQVEYPKDTTIFSIMGAILNAANFSLEALGTHDDGIVNTLQPEFWVNSVPFENAANSIYRLLNMTKGFLRVEPYPNDEWMGKLLYVEKWGKLSVATPSMSQIHFETWDKLSVAIPSMNSIFSEYWSS